MKKISEYLEGVKTLGIAGHVRPDGDCVGSCMGLYLYIKENYPQIAADVYMEEPKPVFGYIQGMDEVRSSAEEDKAYDLFVILDVSSKDRVGAGADRYLEHASRTLCIDHHISNQGLADENIIFPEISSTAEVLYGLLDPEKVTKEVATAIYTGIIHDTGVFQYSSTTGQTMRIAADLLEKGVEFHTIIDESFYQKTYVQNQIMGRVLAESILLMNGRCIVGIVKYKDLEFYGIEGKDLDGIVSQLRLTKGVEVAIFIYEMESQHYKVSLRSNGKVDVSKVASYFGGGGHVRASGCDMRGSAFDVINNLTLHIEEQLEEKE